MYKIVKLNGGLGNQMFQYAFACVLKQNFKVNVFFDFEYFEDVKKSNTVTTRFYGLGNFNLNCDEATQEMLLNVKKPEIVSKNKRFIAKKFPRVFNINYIRTKNEYAFYKDLLKNPNYLYYEGYFQNEKYFKDIKPELLNDFTLKDELDDKNKTILKEITKTNSVSLHVRRGDYITLAHANKIHGLCPIDYYNKAIKYIGSHVDCPHFYLFSDDIAWVKENIKIDYPYTVVDFNGEKDYIDMELMKNCKHNIIANSSFSWWGAWLNQNPNKIVIAPKHWLACNKKCEIVPKEWVKL